MFTKSVKDIGSFLVTMLLGIILDFTIYRLYELLKPTQFSSKVQMNSYFIFIGIIQLFLNLFTIQFIRLYQVSGDLSIMGLFIPQSIIFKKLYQQTYIDQETEQSIRSLD